MYFVSSRSRVSRFALRFGVVPCQILDSAFLIILCVHEHGRLGFWMFSVKTAVSI